MPEPSADAESLLPSAIDALIARTGDLTPIKSDVRSQVWHLEAKPDADEPALRRDWALKRCGVPRWKAWAPPGWRLTPGHRQAFGARRLAGSSLRFAGPAAVVQRGAAEYTVVPWVEGVTLDAWWPDALPEDRLRMAGSLGRLLGMLTAHRLRNRDFKPTNLLVDAEAEVGGLPVMIDLDGVDRGGWDRDAVRSAAVLERALRRIDRVEPGEADAFDRACGEAAPKLFDSQADRIAAFREAIDAAHDARPLSYDPAP